MIKGLKVLVVLLLLPITTWGRELYNIKRLSERQMLETYTSVLVDACKHSDQFWKTSSFDPSAGYWGDGVSDGNQGIRAVGEMVFVCATLLKYSDSLTEEQRAGWLTKSRSAIRFATATHLTGTQKCPDGKSWGNGWQSAMWAGTLGFGAWLIWDKLDSQLQEDLERVIGFEADRFLSGNPPGGTLRDTKAEENGWNLICVSIAANMFPSHSHAAAWNAKAIEYMINTLSVPQDRTNQTIVDGKPISEWFSGENVHPDFTLENHGFFHPAYIACSSYFLTQTAMHYTCAGRPVPQAATHHLIDVWKMFQKMILPSGEPAYPQGMDWELHGISVLNLFASLASYQQDPLAARLEQKALQYMRAWQVMENGNLAVPGSRLGFTRHAICAEQAAYGFLAHKLFGRPVTGISANKAVSKLSGVQTLEFVQFISHRTADKFVSFSWKNRVGGMVMPIHEDYDDNPHFTVPIPNGLVGSFELAPMADTKLKLVDHTWTETKNGFETSGTLLLNGGRLKQMVKVTSIGEKTVVYEDSVVALTNVTVSRERGIPLGIENDKITGGTRTVFYQGGQTVFDWQNPKLPFSIPGRWANVDGRLGVVTVAGSGLSYVQANGYHRGMAVYADVMYASSTDTAKTVKAGNQVARRVVVLFSEVSPAKTEKLAKACCIQRKGRGEVLRLKLPDGGETDVPLAPAELAWKHRPEQTIREQIAIALTK